MKSKKNDYKFWHSPIALAFLFFIVLFFGYKIIDLIKIERETTEKKNLVLDQIEDLKKREVSLSSDISKLQTEEGKENIIREKYQVVKEGEKMVIIVDENNKNDSQLEQNKTDHGFFEWFKSVFKR
jgi:cell division protein FtsB